MPQTLLEINVPHVNENDRLVTLTEWCVAEGDVVRAGQVLCIAETSKTALEIEAPEAGIIAAIYYDEGDEVPVGATICQLRVVSNPISATPREDRRNSVDRAHTATPAPVLPSDGRAEAAAAGRFSNQALELMQRCRLEPEMINPRGFISTKDVYRVLEKRGSDQAADPLAELRQSTPEPDLVRLCNAFARDKQFRHLTSELKTTIYRQAGADIGAEFQIGDGSQLNAARITIGRHVAIGPNVTIKADRISIAAGVRIGEGTHIATGVLFLGEGTVLAQGVKIDMAGGKTVSSGFSTGSECLVSDGSFLNTSRPITMGHRVALSPGTQIYTHGFWQSVLDGYQVNFNPVRLETDSWVGSGVTVMPGVKVGRGAVVLSNSLVAQNVGANTMVGGIPAVVLKTGLRKEFSVAQKEKIILNLLHEFAQEMSDWGYYVEHHTEQDGECFTWQIEGVTVRLAFWPTDSDEPTPCDIAVGFFSADRPPASACFDLACLQLTGPESPLVHELRDFFRRRGIRFGPGWCHYDLARGLRDR